MAGVVQSLQETVQGMRVVKSYTAEATMRERFDHAAQDTRERADNLVRIRAWTSPLMEGLGGALIAFLILFSGWQAVALDKTPGEFRGVSFLAFLLAYRTGQAPRQRASCCCSATLSRWRRCTSSSTATKPSPNSTLGLTWWRRPAGHFRT